MSKTLHGTTTVTVGDDEFTLVPTLAAVRSIEARFGGLRGAYQAIVNQSIDGSACIIASGAGLSSKAAEALPEKIFQVGILKITEQLFPYIGALYNPRGGDDQGNAQAGTE